MHFRKALFLGLSALAAHAVAQERLAFTSFPSSVTAGEPVTITYAGGDPNEVSTPPGDTGPTTGAEDGARGD